MYIQVDDDFPNHPKSVRLCNILSNVVAWAFMVRLWCWACKYQHDGELGDYEAAEIEAAAGWPKADGKFYAAAAKVGFIDEDAPGRPGRLHDWMARTGGDIERMKVAAERSRNRKRAWRERTGNGDVPRDNDGTSPGHGEPGDAEERVGNAADKTSQVQARQVKQDPDPISPPIERSGLDPAGARSNGRASPVTGHSLCALFGKVRGEVVGGFPWQSVRVLGGTATEMAELIDADPALLADVEPTMRLLFEKAKAGKAGGRSADILREPSFAFGAWCSQWTALREELHGCAPKVPDAAKPRPPGELPWKSAEKADEARKSRERMETRRALEELNAKLANGKAVAQ